MIKVLSISSKGIKKEAQDMPSEIKADINLPLIAQAVRVYEDRTHKGVSRTKTRAEVNISKKKIYKQKGTGGARHGAKSAPIFVGGGTAHGPHGIKRELKLSKNMKRIALLSALNLKASEGKLIISDEIGFKKTKDASEFIDNIRMTFNLPKNSKISLFLDVSNKTVKTLRNIPNLYVEYFKNANSYVVFKSNIVVIEKEALSQKVKKDTKETQSKSEKEVVKTNPAEKKKKLVSKKIVKKTIVKTKKTVNKPANKVKK